MQILLVYAAKGAEEVSHRLPQAFKGVDLDFSEAIALLVARLFFLPMTDPAVTTAQVIVASPLLTITGRAAEGELLHMPVQSLLIGTLDHAQATLAAASPDRPDHRRAVIVVRPMPPPLIGAPPWRIRLMRMFFSFFPPRSETSHWFRSGGLLRVVSELALTRSRCCSNVTRCSRLCCRQGGQQNPGASHIEESPLRERDSLVSL